MGSEMKTIELLFALNIRNFASDLKSVARAKYYALIFENFQEEARNVKLAQWDVDHPFDIFITQALSETKNIALKIRNLSSRRLND